MKEELGKPILDVLNGKALKTPPVWLMRQAGRYLPEYQALRKEAGSFWTLAMTPDLATEITLQPIRRFGMDAAILFSDILVIPFALGQAVRFVDGEGPSLSAFDSLTALDRDQARWGEKLAPVYETIGKVKPQLNGRTTLLGFAGAPWTLASYMIEGKGSPDQAKAKLFAYRDPQGFAALLDVIADAVAWHLLRQIEAGADGVQIFDSWAGGLPLAQIEEWVIKPTTRIVKTIRAAKPDAKIIGFPRATSEQGYVRYAETTGVNAVSIDTATSMAWAAHTLAPNVALQGNLDPLALVAGGAALDAAVDRILQETQGAPLIFNLGHGVLQTTPPEHVAQVVQRLRSRA